MMSSCKGDDMLCANGIMERPRYFPRQLITPAEMTLEQTYFRDKFRRLVRLLHGWGVVCGAQVCVAPKRDGSGAEPWKARVKPGYILGPYGDEIVIDQEHTIDLRTTGMTAMCGGPPGDFADPWCAEVFVKRERSQSPLYVAVQYTEVPTRPVRVQPVGCGCDDTPCEYSRWCDGYEIGILEQPPDTGVKPPDPKALFTPPAPIPDCSCPTSPWVVLAEVQVDSAGAIKQIDNCTHRRLVASFSQFWWQCSAELPQIDTVAPSVVHQDDRDVELTVTGSNIKQGANVYLGPGIAVSAVSVTIDAPQQGQQTLKATITVAVNAALGDHPITIINPDCGTTTTAGKLTVEPKTS
jgi:hypothetical protein